LSLVRPRVSPRCPFVIEFASWSSPSPWIGIAIAVAALVAAIVYPARASRIAARALAVSEREERRREAHRRARARVAVEARIIGLDTDERGAIRLGGSHGNLRLEILLLNDGDRDAGRGHIEMTAPSTMSDLSLRWSDASGRELPAYPERAARIGDRHVLTRKLDGVARDVPERLYATLPVAVPDAHGVNEYPIRLRVSVEGMDEPAELDFPLRIARSVNG
jgi:hypothetical protein